MTRTPNAFYALLAAQLGMPVKCECPACGLFGTHETNGDRQDPSALCEACGCSFDLDEAFPGLEGSTVTKDPRRKLQPVEIIRF